MFEKITQKVSRVIGSPTALFCALLACLIWNVVTYTFQITGDLQLIVNLWLSELAFIITMLIQNTQNRDTRALHLKLDALIISIKETDNKFAHIEIKTSKELESLGEELECQPILKSE